MRARACDAPNAKTSVALGHGEPKLVLDTGSVAAGDDHLSSGSAAIGAGTTESASSGDACGAPWGAAPDVGAW